MVRAFTGQVLAQTEQPIQSRGLMARVNWYTPLPLPAFTSTILDAAGAFWASSWVRAKGRMVAWGQT